MVFVSEDEASSSVDVVEIRRKDGHRFGTDDLRKCLSSTAVQEGLAQGIAASTSIFSQPSPIIDADTATLADDERLQRAAVAPRLASIQQMNVVKAVEVDLGVSGSTAVRLIGRARAAGYLPAKDS